MECDLHSEYGIDLNDTALMGARDWRWLQGRIIGLTTSPTCRLYQGRA